MSDYSRVEFDSQDYNETGVAFYSALAQEIGGPVLEIACGSGRVSIPIARLGFGVTGLDINPEMLGLARSKAGELAIRWVEADGRDFDLHERFRLVFLTGNAFQQFLRNADQEALLQCVSAHLEDEGWFAFETRNPLWSTPQTRSRLEAVIEEARLRTDLFLLLETREEEALWQTYKDSKGRVVRETFTQTYDAVSQILHLTSYKRWREAGEDREDVTHEALRFTSPEELIGLLHRNGFEVVRQYGDWDLGPLRADSPSIIVVCRKRQPASPSGG